jgi:hypothetical protein
MVNENRNHSDVPLGKLELAEATNRRDFLEGTRSRRGGSWAAAAAAATTVAAKGMAIVEQTEEEDKVEWGFAASGHGRWLNGLFPQK